MRKGPYRQYLRDVNIPIPSSTFYRWQQEENNQDEMAFENEVAPIAGAIPSEQPRETSSSNSSDESMDWGNDADDACYDSRQESDGIIENENSSSRCLTMNEEQQANLACGIEDNCNNDNSSSNDSLSYRSDNDQSSDIEIDSIHDVFQEIPHWEEDDVEPPQERVPLYEGCDITIEESELLIMTYAIRFGLSDVALKHLLQLIDCHLPGQQHRSLYMFLKNFPSLPEIVTHYFCPNCQTNITFPENNRKICECGVQCDKNYLKIKGSYFLHIPLKEQLRTLMQDKKMYSNLRWEDDTQSDVISGKIYKKFIQKGVISRPDITLQWNTDGVQMFKSSKVSLWPIQVSVNELPYNLRKENILLCGIWYGAGKPNMNVYLQPFIDELNMLHNDGFECRVPDSVDPVQIRVHTILASVDSQARPLLQNIKTFRGKQGCSFCLHEGEEVAVGRGAARMFRGDVGELRTQKQHLNDTATVERTGVVVSGIKGASVLLLLNVFNIIASFVPEYMHCVLLGVVKTMAMWWTAGSNKEEPFYFGSDSKIDEFDSILMSMKPPSEVTRTPRSLRDMKLWKASEWKNFLLYYSIPCMQAIAMPKKYIDHWFLLVFSMHVFLKERFTQKEFSKAESALRKFVLTIEDIYNVPTLMKFNIHLLLHIPKSVQDFGALWGSSAFPYETYNGTLATMFKSSQFVPQQICKCYLRLQAIKEKASDIFVNNHHSVYAKSLYDKFTFRKSRSGHCVQYGNSVRLFGAPDYFSFTLIQKVEVERLVREEVLNNNVLSYKRFIFKNVLFHVEGYERMTKRINNTVELQDKTLLSIIHVLIVKTARSNRSLCVLLGMRLHPTNDHLCTDRTLHITSGEFAHIVERTPECIAVFPDMLLRKCIVIPHDRKLCVLPLVNTIERD